MREILFLRLEETIDKANMVEYLVTDRDERTARYVCPSAPSRRRYRSDGFRAAETKPMNLKSYGNEQGFEENMVMRRGRRAEGSPGGSEGVV